MEDRESAVCSVSSDSEDELIQSLACALYGASILNVAYCDMLLSMRHALSMWHVPLMAQ